MSHVISKFELEVLESILNQHFQGIEKRDYVSLRVKSREYTSVGGYVNFLNSHELRLPELGKRELGFNGQLMVPGVPSGLGAIVAVDQGKIKYLELFTYGDEKWNGETTNLKITSYVC